MSSYNYFGIVVTYLVLYIKIETQGLLLQSPRVTTWGEVGLLEKCTPGKYVTGMQLKVESDQGLTKDDTALNGIRFFCSYLNETGGSTNRENPITSAIGPWGFWRSISFCSQEFEFEEFAQSLSNKVAIGFRLRSEGIRNHRDDTGANNLILVCADVNPETGEHKGVHRIEGDGTRWGDWTDEQICPNHFAICGLATQIEYSQGRRHDDTSLNNIDVECCPIIRPVINSHDEIEITNIEEITRTDGTRTHSTIWELPAEETEEDEITPEELPEEVQSTSKSSITVDESERSTEGLPVVQSTNIFGLHNDTTIREFLPETTFVSKAETKVYVQDTQHFENRNKYKEDNARMDISKSVSTTTVPLDYASSYDLEEENAEKQNIFSETVHSTGIPNKSLPANEIENNNVENSKLQADADKDDKFDTGYEYGNDDSLVSNGRISKLDMVLLFCVICRCVALYVNRL